MNRLMLKRRMARLCLLSLGLGCGITVLSGLCGLGWKSWFTVLGLVLLALGVVFRFAAFRCPRCKEGLLPPRWSGRMPSDRRDYCPRCGWPVLYDDELDKYKEEPEDRDWYRRNR